MFFFYHSQGKKIHKTSTVKDEVSGIIFYHVFNPTWAGGGA